MRAYLREASLLSSSDLAPVTTIFPLANTSAVVLGLVLLACHGDTYQRVDSLSNTHDDGSETLGVVLGVACMESNGLEIQASRQVHGGDNVLQSGNNTRSAVGSIGGIGRSSDTVDLCITIDVLLRGRRSQLIAVRVGQAAWSDELHDS